MYRTIEKKQSKAISWNRSTVKYRLVVEYGMIYIPGNSQPYFSIGASEEHKTRYGWKIHACGCMHDEIAQKFPRLKELIKYHLCGQDGLPMHYVANAVYLAEQGNWEAVWQHIRLQKDEYRPDRVASPSDWDLFEQWLEARKSRLKHDFDLTMAAFGVEYIDMNEYI